MSYVQPNSDIYLLEDVPLDLTYEHTIWFASDKARYNYFFGKTKHSFTKLTYQRVNRGAIRVQDNANNLYKCNYLMFRNVRSNTPSKWYYAFVTSVEYINENTTEIVYVIDDMQTWYNDAMLKQCFVERQHVTDDTIGSNTVPENLEIGPYITTQYKSINVSAVNLHVYIYSTENPADFEQAGRSFSDPDRGSGLPIPCYYLDCGAASTEDTLSVLKANLDIFARNGKSEAVVGIYLLPKHLKTDNGDIYDTRETLPTNTISITPHNNKLYTFPYVCLTVTGESSSVILRYENFDESETPNRNEVRVLSTFGPGMEIACYPLYYEGMRANVDYTVTVTKFPLLPYIKDYFQNWLAQNKANIALNIGGAVLKAGVGIATAGASLEAQAGLMGATAPILNANNMQRQVRYLDARMNLAQSNYDNAVLNSGASTLTSVASTLAQVYQASIVPDSIVGQASAPDVLCISGSKNINLQCKAIKPEYAHIVDDYFSKYGYAIHRVQVPNTHARANWTYVKTVGCVISTSCPADAERNICRIFDNGITFWTSGNNVGNYGDGTNPIV